MLALIRASGCVVTRDEMLAEIWNTPFAGSNKVDAVILSLRKKLGPLRTFYRNGDGPRLPLRRMEAKCD
jgi:DNA-binding response OmpR family regulator